MTATHPPLPARAAARIQASPGRAVVLVAGATRLALAAFAPLYALVAVVGAIALALLGWPTLVGARGRWIQVAIVALPSAGAIWAAGYSPRPLHAMAVIGAGGVVAAFATAFINWEAGKQGVENVAALVSGCAVGMSLAGWLLARSLPGGSELVITGAVMVAVAALTSLLNLSELALLATATVIGLVGGAIVGAILPAIPIIHAAVIGTGAGLAGAGAAIVVTGAPSMHRVGPWCAAALLPLAAVGLLVYGVGRLLPLA